MDEDMGFDSYLEEMYEDRFGYVDDAEEFERNQFALDNDFDGPYDEDDDDPEWYIDSDEYDDGPLY